MAVVFFASAPNTLRQIMPLVVEGDAVFVKTRRVDSDGHLVLSDRLHVPLRRFGSLDMLLRHLWRRNLATLRKSSEREIQQLISAQPGSVALLKFFLCWLVPTFQRREIEEDFAPDLPSEPAPSLSSSADPFGFEAVAAFQSEIPNPSLWNDMGVVPLVPLAPGKSGPVRLGDRSFETSRTTLAMGSLDQKLMEIFRTRAKEMTEKILTGSQSVDDHEQLPTALATLTKQGFVQRGDLLFIPGSPPMLGYLVPKHMNMGLGRMIDGDVAMAAPFTLPARISRLNVLHKQRGRWVPLRPPHGLCLGRGPRAQSGLRPELKLAAYLRWAAVTVAQNRKFHEADGRPRRESRWHPSSRL